MPGKLKINAIETGGVRLIHLQTIIAGLNRTSLEPP